MPALLVLLAVAAVWGVTFVRVEDAVALSPLLAFLAGDRLGAIGWGGCAVILAGIVLAEPAAALARLVRGRVAA